MKLFNSKTKVFALINILIAVVFSIIVSIGIASIFEGLQEDIKKEMISSIAEMEKKEDISISKYVDYDSKESVTSLYNRMLSREYLKDTRLFLYEKRQFFSIFFLLLSFFLALLLGNYIFFSIKKKSILLDLDRYIDSLVKGDYQFILEDDREDVLAKISGRLNKLCLYLKKKDYKSREDLEQLRLALADISHQIKTPLTSLAMNNEILLEDEMLNQDQVQFLSGSQNQIMRLTWLTDSLLKLSKLESNTIKFKKKKLLACDLTDGFEFVLIKQLKMNDLRIKRRGNMKTVLNVDFDWTREALLNIVKNATEHAKRGSDIVISFVDNPSFSGIEVINEGEPIADKDLVKIFERFYKSPSNKNPESIGIGLNLSKKIVEAQGGIIGVTNEVDKIKFSILFLKI